MKTASAIGPREGDYLKLENQWARVAITRDEDYYVVAGDAVRKAFKTADAALAYAVASLAEYQEGAFRS